MSNQALQQTNKSAGELSFVPFGQNDAIKLSVSIVRNFIATPTRSGKLPNDRDCMRFVMLCKAQKLDPFALDAFLVGYDGKEGPQFSQITAHSAFLKRAEASPEYEGMESGVILLMESGETKEREGDFHLPDEHVVGGWAKVYRKTRKPTYRRLAIEQRKPKYETQFWSGAKEAEQIVKCAEADALRATFPTLLGGLYTHGEILEVSAEVTPVGRTLSLPSSALVDVKPADQQEQAGETQTQEQEPTKAPATNGSRAELTTIILDAGFSFTQFQKWAVETGQIENADSLASFEDVPEAIAKRLVRARTGLLKGLAEAKEAGAV